jgi:hypothetical protein
MKYIVFAAPDGYEYPIIFPPLWGHDDMARKIGMPHLKVVAAGFIRTDANGKLECTGRSSSLNIPSRPDRDAAVISKWLADK